MVTFILAGPSQLEMQSYGYTQAVNRSLCAGAAMLIMSACGLCRGQIPSCAELLPTPVYPPLAKQARIQGIVKAHIEIGPDGRVAEASYEGPPVLAQPLEIHIVGSSMDERCAGSLDVTYRFAIVDAASSKTDTVAFSAPGEFLVSTGPQEITCMYYTPLRRKSWIKRVFEPQSWLK